MNKMKHAKNDRSLMIKLHSIAVDCKIDITQMRNFDSSVRGIRYNKYVTSNFLVLLFYDS